MPAVKRRLPFDRLMKVRCYCGHYLEAHHHGASRAEDGCGCLKCMVTGCTCVEFRETGVEHPENIPKIPCRDVELPLVEAVSETEIRPARQRFVEHGGFQIELNSVGMFFIDGPNGMHDRGLSNEELIQLQEVTAKAIAKLVTEEDDRKNRGK